MIKQYLFLNKVKNDMIKEIDLKIQNGPCVVCGKENYPLSVGGPSICPACDCGVELKIRLKTCREQIKQFQAENENLKEILDRSIKLIKKMKKLLEIPTIRDGIRYDISPKFYEDIEIELFIIEQALKEE